MNDFDQMAQSQSTPAAAPAASAVAPATSNTGNDFEQMAQQAVASTPTTTTGTNAPTTPSYLSQVEDHIANTAHAIWHGLSGAEHLARTRSGPNRDCRDRGRERVYSGV